MNRKSVKAKSGSFVFRCKRCGKCCREEGVVHFRESEIVPAAKMLGITRQEFEKEFLISIGSRKYHAVTDKKGCRFLNGSRCIINDVKPKQCSTFPYWKEYVNRNGELRNFLRPCPGVTLVNDCIVYLVRHYPVDLNISFSMNSADVMKYQSKYDIASVRIPDHVPDMGAIDICFSSDMPRAVSTAKHMYGKKIRIDPLLREVSISPVIKTRILFPSFVWLIAARIAWSIGLSSQKEKKAAVYNRAFLFSENLMSEIERKHSKTVLVVAHGFFITVLANVLRKKGFRGRNILFPRNGSPIKFILPGNRK